MCMLAGWYKPGFGRDVDRETLFRHLVRKCQIGGSKSLGIAYMSNGKMKVIKYTGSPAGWLLQNSKDVPKIAESDIVLIHTRQPTQGAVTKINCHPFELGEWIAAHNGMISNSGSLLAAAKYIAQGETDSEEALAYVVGENFHPDALEEIKGYYAFEAVKVDGSELVLVCDDRADLHCTCVGEGIIWCTSQEILYSSLVSSGMDEAAVGTAISPIKCKIIRMPGMRVEEIDTPLIKYTPAYEPKATAPTAESTMPLWPKDGPPVLDLWQEPEHWRKKISREAAVSSVNDDTPPEID